MIYKCKICGGDLEVAGDGGVFECQSCGTMQTIPKLDEEKKALYERAGHFRRNNEYDKAQRVYERILEIDPADPEAHWSILLCKYGVEYVEDPRTHRRVITCNRTLRKSILADADYKAAVEQSFGGARHLYEEEAQTIDSIQKRALSISENEEPFDIFICYKETESSGKRTKDSVRAQEIYQELTKEGYKIFFARITLQDKIGTEYEPYIFAALNSSKIMIVLATSKENVESVWVKNEWGRFLALMEEDGNKKLIPAYEDMDPYDLPEEFAYLQALNMGGLGFIQDLTNGIRKIMGAVNELEEAPKTTSSNGQEEPLLKRVSLCLEDGDWDKANELIEQILNLNPENPITYLYKLMAELRVGKESQLAGQDRPFAASADYQKILRFGDEDLKARIVGFNDQIVGRLEKEKERKEAERLAVEERNRKINSLLDAFNSKVGVGESKNQIAIIDEELQRTEMQIEALNQERSKLGLFDGAKKKSIDYQLAPFYTQKGKLLRQRSSLQDGKQTSAIAWIVLGYDEESGRALLITKDCIARKPYNNRSKSITWENCTLRRWLNTAFYSEFSESQKAMIGETLVRNTDNPQYKTVGGNDTNDKVFLLSIDEVNKYFKDNAARVADYKGEAVWWWLRSPGLSSYDAAGVGRDGDVYEGGGYVDYADGVRPALYLNLKS